MENGNKVYVVKSVNLNDLGEGEDLFLLDDNGLGVFLTLEEAEACFKKTVDDLEELYGESDDFITDEISDYVNEGNMLKGYYCHYINKGFEYADFVGLYECTIGVWNC